MSMIMDLIARIRANTSGFEGGMQRIERAAEKTSKKISSEFKSKLAGAFSLAAVTAAGKSVLSFADRMDTLAQQSEIAVEDLQRLNFVAASTSITIEEIVNAFKGLAKARSDALSGEAGNRKELFFGQIGISRDELGQLDDMMALFTRVSDAVSRMGPGSSRLALVQELFSEAGVKILPVFNAQLDEILKKFDMMGGPIGAGAVSEMASINAQFRQFGIHLNKVISPALREVTKLLAVAARETARMPMGPGYSAGGVYGQTYHLPQTKIDPNLGGSMGPYRTMTGWGIMMSLMEAQRQFRPSTLTDNRIPGSLQTDSLTSIGNFLGAAGPRSPQADAIVRNTGRTAMNTEELKRAVANRALAAGADGGFFSTLKAIFP